MEKKQYNLCLEVLRRFEKAGVLDSLVLIGSWCLPFYGSYFKDANFGLALRTRDLDFLVPFDVRFKHRADIPALLSDLGFVVSFLGDEGYIRIEHPDLAVEFLVPEKGSGTRKPAKLPYLGVNAQSLRHLDILIKYVIRVEIGGIRIRLPHPVLFAFHKLIVSGLRKNRDKSEKDAGEAVMVLREVLSRGGRAQIIRHFQALQPSLRKKVESALRNLADVELREILHRTEQA